MTIQSVEAVETRTGKTRYVIRADDGGEYTTFRPQIGKDAARFEGKRAQIEWHEDERNGFRNVYLDKIGPAPAGDDAREGGEGQEAEEVAWKTAVDSAPWLLGKPEPEGEIAPEELYEKLEPFKKLVADDIERGSKD